MAKHEASSPRWRRFVVEVLTIVLGVLLALGADEGRQYLSDRATEREILTALKGEFDADTVEIGSDQANRMAKLDAIERLNGARSGTATMPPPDTLAGNVLWLLNWRYYTARHPVLDDALSTGRFDLIRSNALREALVVFQQERSRIGVTEEQEREFVSRQLQPYLAERLDLEALSSPRTPEQRAQALRALPWLLRDKTFGSILFLSRDRTENSHDFANRLLATVDSVRKELELEMPGGGA
jgi:hypothetical protein